MLINAQFEHINCKVAIVISTFNRKNLLYKLLWQLHFQIQNYSNIDIIIVVDGSIDGTVEMLIEYFPKVHIVMGDGTWWFTRSANEGFKVALKLNAEYVLLLNDDVTLDSIYIKTVIDSIKYVNLNKIIGSICFTKEKPYRIFFSGVKKINKITNSSIHYYTPFHQIEPSILKGIYPSKVLSGRGMLIPTKILKELNLFDEFFLQYLSDNDFCRRATKVGYEVLINWDAKLYTSMNDTSNSTSFRKKTLGEFTLSFLLKTSRNNIKQRLLFLWRHGMKILIPLSFTIWIFATINANFIRGEKYYNNTKRINSL